MKIKNELKKEKQFNFDGFQEISNKILSLKKRKRNSCTI